MNLLVITQKVDSTDPTLGFFHRWIEVLAEHHSHISVICLEKGTYNLPQNVEVVSLGKESGGMRIQYVVRFLRTIFLWRKKYDMVFVHMNEEYVLLGGLMWKFFKKRVYLWRNHPKGNFLTTMAVSLSYKVFCTSPQSFTARFKKTSVMPVGIPTEFFKSLSTLQRSKNSILFLGRISPVKRAEILIEALRILKSKKINFLATIAGSVLPVDTSYQSLLTKRIKEYGLEDRVKFEGATSSSHTLELYNTHEVCVNATPSGSLDKTQFEAMACGTLILTGNRAFLEFLPKDLVEGLVYKEADSNDLALKLEKLFDIGEERKRILSEILRQIVVKNHSLALLVSKLSEAFRA